jgi:hypothetical protein
MKYRALIRGIVMMTLCACGCQKQPTRTVVASGSAAQQTVISFYLARDAVGGPPREPERIVLQRDSHLGVALINDTDHPCRVLWNGHNLRCLYCRLYKEDGPVDFHAIIDLLPPRLPQDVFTLLPGAKIVDQNAPFLQYELSWLEPGEYALQMCYNSAATVSDPSTNQTAELTPVSLEKWVGIKLIR